MDQLTVERSIFIAADRDRVWQALTNPEQLVQWLVPNLPGAVMKRDDRNKISVYLGEMGMDFVMLDTSDLPRQITSQSLPDKLLTITYTLDEQNSGTLVTVSMSGFEALPADVREDRLHLSGSGWEKTLKNLNAFVAGTELPFPQAFVAPLFGYWRELAQKIAVERSIWINAGRERVWRAITDPEILQRWLSPATPWQLSALEVGGRFYVNNVETSAEMYVEIIERLDPLQQLVTRALPEAPDTVVKTKMYTLKEENGGTRLTVTLIGYENDTEANRWSRMEENTFGFGMMLQNAKAYLEGAELPFPWGF
jgi:uncharacterized protein YndB with AHSA1/START domain